MDGDYTVTLSEYELQVIGRGLAELPYKLAEPVIRRLVDQTEPQREERQRMGKGPEVKEPEVKQAEYRTPSPEEFKEAMRRRNGGERL